jgi:hypothetical protein
MATSTLGTNATTSIPTAMSFVTTNPIADFGSVANAVLDDVNRVSVSRIWPGAWDTTGVLYVPNRGFLRCLPGDWVGVDSRGWPILLSADTIANGLWSHSP